MKSLLLNHSIISPLVCLSLLSFVAANEQALAQNSWRLPTPSSHEHPGAAAAPASSPLTYSDEVGFHQRAKLIMEDLAKNDLAQWRRGYFTGGDPGKYLPAAAAAKLLLDSEDAEARRYMNDDRSYREQYHFASLNWARFLPLFLTTLEPQTRQKLSDAAFRADAYLAPRGTENHKTMWWTSANVLPHYLLGGVAHRSREESLAQAREMLRQYVRNLYHYGQGEWDSSTYLMFDVNGLLNIYDFSPDPQARLLAKAGLDWLLAGYALKYRDGVYTAPNQRGFAAAPHESIADQTGWLWWGSNHAVKPGDTRRWFYTWHAATSSYRPNKTITAIATNKLRERVFEARNTKPNYWHGQGIAPRAAEYFESVFTGRTFTLGSLWNGFGGQMTRLQLVCESPDGGVVFTGGHPRKSDHTGKRLDEITYRDGGGRYDQSAQIGGAYLSMTQLPDDEPLEYSFFAVPPGVSTPVKRGDWWTMRVGETFIGLFSLGGEASVETTIEKGSGTIRYLRFPGKRTGFILQVASAYDSFFILRHEGAFKLLNPPIPRPTVEQLYNEFGSHLQSFCKVDTARWKSEGEVSWTAFDAPFPNDGRLVPGGTQVRARYQPGKDRAAVWVQAPFFRELQPVGFEGWPVYNSRYIHCDGGVLSVNDGGEGFVIDFSGELPLYKPWQKTQP